MNQFNCVIINFFYAAFYGAYSSDGLGYCFELLALVCSCDLGTSRPFPEMVLYQYCTEHQETRGSWSVVCVEPMVK